MPNRLNSNKETKIKEINSIICRRCFILRIELRDSSIARSAIDHRFEFSFPDGASRCSALPRCRKNRLLSRRSSRWHPQGTWSSLSSSPSFFSFFRHLFLHSVVCSPNLMGKTMQPIVMKIELIYPTNCLNRYNHD